MRLEYRVDIGDIAIPRFSVEAPEGIQKLFTLATLVFNLLDAKPCCEIVFHGLNPEDPERKIDAFKEIMASCETAKAVGFDEGGAGRIAGGSSYYQWLTVRGG